MKNDMDIQLNQAQLGSILEAVFYLANCILAAAVVRGIMNK